MKEHKKGSNAKQLQQQLISNLRDHLFYEEEEGHYPRKVAAALVYILINSDEHNQEPDTTLIVSLAYLHQSLTFLENQFNQLKQTA